MVQMVEHLLRPVAFAVALLICDNFATYARNGDGGASEGQCNVAGSRSYASTFPATEPRISEKGAWIDGKTEGIDWADVATLPGLAYGVNLPTQYADPTAVLGGEWGSNQQAEGKVRVETPMSTCCHEVELRLRTTITPHAITGYEINCSLVPGYPYLQIGRWNGPLNDFIGLGEARESCADGDVLKATAIGDVITAYKNGVQVLQVRDARYATGSPGMGFYHVSFGWARLVSPGWRSFGFSSFAACDDGTVH
jgi:hypothetical protein